MHGSSRCRLYSSKSNSRISVSAKSISTPHSNRKVNVLYSAQKGLFKRLYNVMTCTDIGVPCLKLRQSAILKDVSAVTKETCSRLTYCKSNDKDDKEEGAEMVNLGDIVSRLTSERGALNQ